MNGQHSFWHNVTTGVPQGSTLGALLFLTYINDIPDDISSNCKLFANNTSLFSVVSNIHTNATTLTQYLNTITNWAFQWKVIFNPALSKQEQEVIFSIEIRKLLYPTLKSRHWFRKLSHFYKIFNEKSPSHLFNLIPTFNRVRNT